MRLFVNISSLLCSIFAVAQLAAQTNITTTVDTTKIMIGEQVSLQVKVTTAAQNEVIWPELKDTLRKEIEVVSASKIDTSFDKEDITTKYYEQTIKLTSFDSGFWAVPPLIFVVAGDTQVTEPFLLSVYSVEIDTAKAIYDIKGPMSVEYTFMDWLKENWKMLALSAAALAALTALFFFLMKRSKQKPVSVEPPPPPVPAHVTALNQLAALKEKKLWQNNKVKLYHIELSEIIREYIEGRYNIPALEQTTDEIMMSMRAVPAGEEVKAKLKQLLELSDLVKFAKATPIATENEMCMQHAEEFVNQTKLVPDTETKPTHHA